MIEAKGKTLFDWSMDSLVGYNNNVNRYVFVVRAEDHAESFIREHCCLLYTSASMNFMQKAWMPVHWGENCSVQEVEDSLYFMYSQIFRIPVSYTHLDVYKRQAL